MQAGSKLAGRFGIATRSSRRRAQGPPGSELESGLKNVREIKNPTFGDREENGGRLAIGNHGNN